MRKRKLKLEQLESRKLLHGGRLDTNHDDKITVADALTVINHIAEERAYVDHCDVNSNNIVSALDALIVINKVQRINTVNPRYEVTFRVANDISTVGYTKQDIMDAIESAFQEYELVGDVDFKITNNGKYSISSDELWMGATWGSAYRYHHARGWVKGGNGSTIIQIHNGKVKAEHQKDGQAKDWQAFSSKNALKRVLMHEIGHALMYWNHTSDKSAVMHINGSSEVFSEYEVDSIIRKWGRSQI